MATKYKAVNAAGLTSSEGTLLYTVPAGRIAKLTFVSCLNSYGRLGIKPANSETIIQGPSVADLYAATVTSGSPSSNEAADCSKMGIYFSEGDQIYAIYSSSGFGFFISLIEEYEED